MRGKKTERSLWKKLLDRIFVLCTVLVLAACAGKTPATTYADSSERAVQAVVVESVVESVSESVSVVPVEASGTVAFETLGISDATLIGFAGTTVSVTGDGATIEGKTITITEPGTYVLTGTLDDGRLVVDSEDKGTVRLVLNGAAINSSDYSGIFVKDAGETVITLVEGTINGITDGPAYVFDDPDSDEPNAAIYSKDDLVIEGEGTLIVHAHFNNGIVSKDDLTILDGIIEVTSVDDGITGKDLLLVETADITIDAAGDGMRSTNDGDEDKGTVVLNGGTYTITAGTDGIQGVSSVVILGGEYDITTGGGSSTVTRTTAGSSRPPMTRETNATTEDDTPSMKGIKATTLVRITGGTFTIDSADDGVHSNDSIEISGGEFTISTGDDGIHADATLDISGGDIDIITSYEGIESAAITVGGGVIDIVSSDDGVNVSGADEGFGFARLNMTASTSSSRKLVVEGGYISIDATGDGIDINGSGYMSGGTIVVSGPVSSGNGALDYDGTFEISGGLLIAVGSTQMMMAPSTQSSQMSVAMTFSRTLGAGTLFNLSDESGDTIAAFAPEKDYQSVIVSSSGLEADTRYTVYSGGNEVVDFIPADTVTWLNESGITTGGNTGPGGFNPGGTLGGGGRPARR